MLFSSTTIS
jgi:P-type E1-E2 ATPase